MAYTMPRRAEGLPFERCPTPMGCREYQKKQGGHDRITTGTNN